MAVNLAPPEAPHDIAGARWTTLRTAVRSAQRDDIAILHLPPAASVAGVFTSNAFAAAPVRLAQQHMQQTAPRALVINSGNANAGTGDAGLADARACCTTVAEVLDLKTAQVLPFSTGVIGERLPLEAMQAALQSVTPDDLSENGWLAAAQAIMTTDTVAKAASRTVSWCDAQGREQAVTLTGIAKGSGMICPDMATMLAFIATDARIEQGHARKLLQQCTERSFNAITVDGDTSTNDACMLCATGQGAALRPADAGWRAFASALEELMQGLAQAIVRDAEGATRFITLEVSGARDAAEARTAAFTVAHSPLVKTACFAGDPNWGRILAAMGRAPINDLDVGGIDIALDDVALVVGGQPAPDYREAYGARIMAQAEYTIRIHLGRGDADTVVWTSDLSYDYVRINAEYRS